jgi:hypothetical protein
MPSTKPWEAFVHPTDGTIGWCYPEEREAFVSRGYRSASLEDIIAYLVSQGVAPHTRNWRRRDAEQEREPASADGRRSA